MQKPIVLKVPEVLNLLLVALKNTRTNFHVFAELLNVLELDQIFELNGI